MAATLSSRLSTHFAPLHDHGTADADLLTRYAEFGDAAAFALLVKRHGGMVAAVCRKRLRHAHDAEDAAQAVFLALARKAGRVAGQAAVAAWLYGAAVKACNEVARRNRRKPWVALTAEPAGDTAVSPDFEAVAAVLDEVARLPEACRAAVVLCELEGVPRALAAKRLGIAEGTLSSRLAAARKRLADRLARRGFGPATLAVLTGLASGVAAPAVSLPALTLAAPAVVRLTEVIMTTTLAWKAKLAATLTVATLTIGMAVGAGDGPCTLPASQGDKMAAGVVPMPDGPMFAVATVTAPIEENPPRIGITTMTVSTLTTEGKRTLHKLLDTSTAVADAERDGAAVTLATVLSVGPDGSYIVQVSAGPVVDMQCTPYPTISMYDGVPSIGWESSGMSGPLSRLYLVNAAGKLARLSDWQLTNVKADWSADGVSLVVTRSDYTTGLIRMNPLALLPGMTQFRTRVDVTTGKQKPLYLPQGSQLLAVRSGGKQLLIGCVVSSHPLAHEEQLMLVTLPDDPDASAAYRPIGKPSRGFRGCAALSPNGTRAIVATAEWVKHVSKAHPPQPPPADGYYSRRFQLVDLDAGTMSPISVRPRAIPDFSLDVRWSPDGNRIAFLDADDWASGPNGPFGVHPHIVTCDPDGRNRLDVPVSVADAKIAPFEATVWNGLPKFVGWR